MKKKKNKSKWSLRRSPKNQFVVVPYYFIWQKKKNARLAKFQWTSRPPVRVVNPICGVQCSAKRGETRFSTAKIQKDFWRCFSSLNSTLKAHFKLWRHFKPLQFFVIMHCSSHFHFILSEFLPQQTLCLSGFSNYNFFTCSPVIEATVLSILLCLVLLIISLSLS